jgi:hypothetical protein
VLKREKKVYSIFFIVTFVLASTVYITAQNAQISLEKEQARELSVEAYAVYSDISKLVGHFYNCYRNIQNIDYQLSEGYISNDTRDTLYDTTLIDYLGNYYTQFYGQTIEYHMANLAGTIGPLLYGVYKNISDTLQYSLDQIDFAWLGRTHNDSHRLLGELYNVLGIYQETQSSNYTALRGIAEPFSEMYIYWEEKAGLLLGAKQPEPNILFNWAIANATQLYQNLEDWHNNNPLT